MARVMTLSAQPAYSVDAGHYDSRTEIFQSCRDRIVEALRPQPGEVLLDVGCGTGLCFSGLRSGVGAAGAVVGIDASNDMVGLARSRAADHGWRNVSVLHASVDEADIPVAADGALFCAVHDVLQNVDGLRNILAQLRPGARVVAGGGKFAAPWMAGLNLQVSALHRPYVRSFDGFAKPWAKLAPFLDDLRVTEFALGTGYCAVGRVRPGLSTGF
jgi:ubiquinone/menaquinone biosynthesis C-methylase UbiE